MDTGIRNKVALVTASSGGMGRNIAHALAAEGADIVLFARSADKLQAVAAEIQQAHGVRVLTVAGDMQERADVERLAASVKQEFGGLDIFILVTGRPPNPLRSTLEETDPARWEQAFRIQLWSAIQLCIHLVPLMQGRGWGRIVAITSASVKNPMPHHALSTVFRAGVTAYMKHLSLELGAHGITANCVAPALIDTSHRVGTAAYTPQQTEARKKMTPLGRMGSQDELCGVVTFLASQKGGFVTGSTIQVEGGMTAALL